MLFLRVSLFIISPYLNCLSLSYLNCFFFDIDYPLDKCPAFLLPVIYGEKEDIHMERILSDSASMASLMVPTLADLLRELGYASCAT